MKKRILILVGFLIATTFACRLSTPSQQTVIAPTFIPTLPPPQRPTDTSGGRWMRAHLRARKVQLHDPFRLENTGGSLGETDAC